MPRIRYALPVVLTCVFSSVFTFTNLKSLEQNNFQFTYASDSIPLEEQTTLQRVFPQNFIDLVSIDKKEQPAKKTKDNGVRTLEIKSGQTIAGIMQKQGVSGAEAYKSVKILSKHVDPRKIKPGQTFTIKAQKASWSPDTKKGFPLGELSMKLDAVRTVSIKKNGNDFKAEIIEQDVQKRTYAGAAQIQTSLYGSAARAGIPSQVIAKMIRMYSWSVDFQRDIRRDDQIEILYDVYETEDGEAVKFGEILYANLNLSGTDIPLYRFEKSDGSTDYYDARGHSIKKTLMKTPVDGARMSSGFGMRHHPVLGYNKMHKGTDFAAPIGTPIYAAGDGILERVGRNGGYGNYMRIRHNNSLKTAYAHLHKFAKGMTKGKRVKQGEVIGYIGSTGRSTGPHLHYEVILDGKQVNPNRVDLPVGDSLKGNDLKNFKNTIDKFNNMYVDLLKSKKYASHQSSGNDKKNSG